SLADKLQHFFEKTSTIQLWVNDSETAINYLKNQVTLYFEYCLLIQNFNNLSHAIENIISTENIKRENKGRFLGALTHFCRLKADLILRVDVMSTRIAQEHKNEDNLFAQLKAQFYQLRNNISELHQELSNLDKVEYFLPSYLIKKALFDNSLDTLESRINHCLMNASPAPTIRTGVDNSSVTNFFDERQRQLQEYKSEVQRNRELSQQQKLEKHPVYVKPEVSSSVNLPVNMDIAYCIGKLHDHDIDLIKSIQILERGIKYRQVENLITSKLGGSIVEIGNGSSHKRIYLNSLYSEICTQTDEGSNTSLASTATVSTGGMYRPHGHAHNSGELSFFNIKLIRNALVRAGITIENIEKIRKESQKLDKVV
ncbi:MAG TPA: hypothetical protein VHA13_06135, partial [Gammaproteobacteria bacterium]|nr:hypothetical protein [Gammaproteobacteria bacterium]